LVDTEFGNMLQEGTELVKLMLRTAGWREHSQQHGEKDIHEEWRDWEFGEVGKRRRERGRGRGRNTSRLTRAE
jgi:hypothetical protein